MSGVTELLRCELPVQLAPMGCVSVTPALPLAVAAAGGHAVYPALALPPAAIAATIDGLSAHTSAFGLNFLIPLMDRGSVEVAAERAPYVDFFLGEADPALVALVHAGGGVCGWQVESPDEARAAEAAGCDLVIAKGSESGGRKRFDGPPLAALLDEVLPAVSVPVIAAGGIASGPGAAAVLAAGADGVRAGTRFIASSESEAHPAWVQAVVEADADEAVVSTAFNAGMPVPGPHRVLRRSIEAAEALADDDVGVVRLGPAEVPVRRFGPMPPSRDSTGAIEAMPFYAGRSAGEVRDVRPAAAIVAELAAGVVAAS